MLTREIIKRALWTGAQAAAALAAAAPTLDVELLQGIAVTALATAFAAIKTAIVETSGSR